MADKKLDKREGTIAHYLTSHKKEIWACGGTYGTNIEAMKEKTLELLSKEEIQDNPETPRAIKILSSKRGNQFLTVLVTYMSGLKVNG